MDYEGIVYRPPSEARSLIIQVTIGCAHNTCGFCNMYKRKRSSDPEPGGDSGRFDGGFAQSVCAVYREGIFGGRRCAGYENRGSSGNSGCDPPPVSGREAGGFYGTAQDICGKSEEELIRLREAGLGIVYVGAESGDNEILKYINKGVTAEQTIEAGQKLKRCGIAISK